MSCTAAVAPMTRQYKIAARTPLVVLRLSDPVDAQHVTVVVRDVPLYLPGDTRLDPETAKKVVGAMICHVSGERPSGPYVAFRHAGFAFVVPAARVTAW